MQNQSNNRNAKLSLEIITNLNDSFRSKFSYFEYVFIDEQDKEAAVRNFLDILEYSHCVLPGCEVKDYPNLKMKIYKGYYNSLYRFFEYVKNYNYTNQEKKYIFDFIQQLLTQNQITKESYYSVVLREYKNV